MNIDLRNSGNDVKYPYNVIIPVSEDLNNDVPIYCVKGITTNTIFNEIKVWSSYTTSRYNMGFLYNCILDYKCRVYRKFNNPDTILAGGGLFCLMTTSSHEFNGVIEPLAVLTCKESYLIESDGLFNTDSLTLYLSEELLHDSRNKKYHTGLKKAIKPHGIKEKYASREVLKKLIFGEPSMLIPKIDLGKVSEEILISLKREYEIA